MGEIQQEDMCYQKALEYYDRLYERIAGSRGSGNPVAFSLYTQMNVSIALMRLSYFQQAETLLLALRNAYDGDYRPPKRLAILYLQWEGTKPREEQSYQKVREWYGQAVELYVGVQATDPEMNYLETIISTLP